MPDTYAAEISRENKACFLFLLDQSFSMVEPLANSPTSKAQQLALVVNNWLKNMVLKAQSGTTVKDWMDIGVLGYRTDQQANPIIAPAFQGPLATNWLSPLPEIAAHARIQDAVLEVPDPETGQMIQTPTKVSVWLEPVSEGSTPMCNTLHLAHGILAEWVQAHPRSFPPIVIHVTDGQSEDGDPVPYADGLRNLETQDGHLLLFNCHLSMTAADPILFPHSAEILPDKEARTLFAMSSEFPQPIFQRAVAEGFPLQPGARGMVFNSEITSLIKFLDLGTRIAAKLR
jgi:hypothetical protein